MRVRSDITTRALSRLIREALHEPLLVYCRSVPIDIEDMVIRDASNSGWLRLDPYSDESYFGDTFLKPHPRKKNSGEFIFSIPANMKLPVFGLVFEPTVWKQVEKVREAEVCSALSTAFSKAHYLL